MPPKARKPAPNCKKCVELGFPKPKKARRQGLCAEHGGKRLCRLCVQEERDKPKSPKVKDLCKEHAELEQDTL